MRWGSWSALNQRQSNSEDIRFLSFPGLIFSAHAPPHLRTPAHPTPGIYDKKVPWVRRRVGSKYRSLDWLGILKLSPFLVESGAKIVAELNAARAAGRYLRVCRSENTVVQNTSPSAIVHGKSPGALHSAPRLGAPLPP